VATGASYARHQRACICGTAWDASWHIAYCAPTSRSTPVKRRPHAQWTSDGPGWLEPGPNTARSLGASVSPGSSRIPTQASLGTGKFGKKSLGRDGCSPLLSSSHGAKESGTRRPVRTAGSVSLQVASQLFDFRLKALLLLPAVCATFIACTHGERNLAKITRNVVG